MIKYRNILLFVILCFSAISLGSRAPMSCGGTNVNWQYTYDHAGNRLTDYTSKVPGGITSVGYSINSVDQIYNSNSSAYPANPDTTYTWDDNGNLDIAQINLGGIILTGNYTWDAKNQLTSVSFPGYSSSEFTYDGLGRRVEITEKNSVGATTSHRYFVWEGMRLAEERASKTGAPVKKFYAQGELRGSAKYYYTKDHLGSTREVLDGNSNIVARYDYDPFGQPTQTVGTMQFDRLFTGHFYHSPSGLYLAPYRAYNPALGRRIGRDPLGEAGGMNLYGYVGNDPLTSIDRYGLRSNGQVELNSSGIGNFLAATGDVMSLGLGSFIRDKFFPELDAVVDEDCPAYEIGKFAGGSISAASTLALRAGTASVQAVTHFAPEAGEMVIQNGRWVMTGVGKGIDGIRNWLFSGASGQFRNAVTAEVERESLKWPSGWQRFKGLLGQRIYVGEKTLENGSKVSK